MSLRIKLSSLIYPEYKAARRIVSEQFESAGLHLTFRLLSCFEALYLDHREKYSTWLEILSQIAFEGDGTISLSAPPIQSITSFEINSSNREELKDSLRELIDNKGRRGRWLDLAKLNFSALNRRVKESSNPSIEAVPPTNIHPGFQILPNVIGDTLDIIQDEIGYFEKIANNPKSTIESVFKALKLGMCKFGFRNITIYFPLPDGKKWTLFQRFKAENGNRSQREQKVSKYAKEEGEDPTTTLKGIIEGQLNVYDLDLNDTSTFSQAGVPVDESSLQNDLTTSVGPGRTLFFRLVSNEGRVEAVIQIDNRIGKENRFVRKEDILQIFGADSEQLWERFFRHLSDGEKLEAEARFPGSNTEDILMFKEDVEGNPKLSGQIAKMKITDNQKTAFKKLMQRAQVSDYLLPSNSAEGVKTALGLYFREVVSTINAIRAREEKEKSREREIRDHKTIEKLQQARTDDEVVAIYERVSKEASATQPSISQFNAGSEVYNTGDYTTEHVIEPAKSLAIMWNTVKEKCNRVIKSALGVAEDMKPIELFKHVILTSIALFDWHKKGIDEQGNAVKEVTGFAVSDYHHDYVDSKGKLRGLVYYAGIMVEKEHWGGRAAYLTSLMMKVIFKGLGFFKILRGKVPLIFRTQDRAIFEKGERYYSAKSDYREFIEEDWNAARFVAQKNGWTLKEGTNICERVYSKKMARNDDYMLPELGEYDGKVCVGYVSIKSLWRLFVDKITASFKRKKKRSKK